MKKFNILPDMSKQVAQAKYIELASACQFYGSCIFYLHFQEASGTYSLPKEVMISISLQGVSIHTRDHRRELMKLEYKEISSWGVSNERLALFVAKNGYQVQFLFKTLQGRAIANLMQGYVNFILDKPLANSTENNHRSRIIGLSRELAIKFPALTIELFK